MGFVFQLFEEKEAADRTAAISKTRLSPQQICVSELYPVDPQHWSFRS